MFISEPNPCGAIYSNKGRDQENFKDNKSGYVMVYDGFQKQDLSFDFFFDNCKPLFQNMYIWNDSLYKIWAYKGDYQNKMFHYIQSCHMTHVHISRTLYK